MWCKLFGADEDREDNQNKSAQLQRKGGGTESTINDAAWPNACLGCGVYAGGGLSSR